MSDIKVVLLPADAREGQETTTLSVGAGTKAWELFKDQPDIVAARVADELKDLSYELADGDEVEGVAIDSSDGHDILRHSCAHVLAQAVQDLFPDAKLGIGPPIKDGFYYDFDVEIPFTPEDLDEDRDPDAQDHQGQPAVLPPGDQRRRRAGRARRRALQARADRPQGLERRRCGRGRRRRGRRRRAHHLRQHRPQRRGRLEGPLPRPAPAHHEADPGVQADALRGGVLARRREEQAAAAGLRHRLGVQGSARRPPPPARGGREARPPQAGPRARPVQLPRRDRLRHGGLPPQGWRDQAGDGGLRPSPAHRGGLPVRRHAPHHARRGSSTPPGTCRTTRTRCSRRWRWRARTTTSRR